MSQPVNKWTKKGPLPAKEVHDTIIDDCITNHIRSQFSTLTTSALYKSDPCLDKFTHKFEFNKSLYKFLLQAGHGFNSWS